jgi:hypothetical protein
MTILQQPVMCFLDNAGNYLLPAGVEHVGVSKSRRALNVHLTAQGTETFYQERASSGSG